MMLVIINQ